MQQINDQVNIRIKKGINRQYSFALTSLIIFFEVNFTGANPEQEVVST